MDPATQRLRYSVSNKNSYVWQEEETCAPERKKNYYIAAEPEGKVNLALWGKNLMTLWFPEGLKKK